MTNPLYDSLLAPHKDSGNPYLVLGNTTLSYGDFLSRTHHYAAQLNVLGVQPGDRIAVQAAKSVEILYLYAACLQTGCVFLPLNTAYTPVEVEYFINDAKPALLLCNADGVKELSSKLTATNCKVLALHGSAESFDEQAKTQEPDNRVADRDPHDLAAILYTSGTTGRSKGAMLTQRNLLSNAQVLKEYWQFSTEDVLLHALPVYHTHGLFVAMNIIMLSGASCIYLPAFNVDDMISNLPQATTMMGVPTFYTRLLNDPRLDKTLVSHMRLFISGSAPLLAETHTEFEQKTGQKILERYGMTETSMSTSNPYDGDRRAGTVGFALPGVEARICQPDTTKPLEDNEVGILHVKGDNVFKGYWQMPEKTAEEFTDDGFFITGDMAKIDADGYVHIVGRDKDLIISGGLNIYPKEIELQLDQMPGVLESAVVGAPHPDFGESVVAVLVAEPGKSVDIDAIKVTLATTLAKFKQPKAYLTRDNLPRNTMGKVQKTVLRDEVRTEFD